LDYIVGSRSFEGLHLEREALRKDAVFSEGDEQPLLVTPHLEQPAIDALVTVMVLESIGYGVRE
jgi:hypothetical protein